MGRNVARKSKLASRDALFQLSYRCGVLPSWAVGLFLAIAIALIAWRAHSLRPSGAVAAVAVGTAAMAGGWDWGILLVSYFVSASVLSRFRGRDKEIVTAGRVEKSGERDAVQVLANGGLFALSALGHAVQPALMWQLAGAGALAASAADTWATEIGVLATQQPRSILSGQPVEPGVSGGVTLVGWLAAMAAAAMLALVVRLLGWPIAAAFSALGGGIAGCALDSMLGAALQARRRCPKCDQATEQRVHRCGTPTTYVGGFAQLTNDGVNFLATAGGAAAGAALALALT